MSRAKIVKRFLAAVAAVPGGASAAQAAISTNTSGVYDEQTTQLNTVEATATTPTAGTVALVNLATFKTDVAAAFTANRGGVVNFDDVTGTPTDTVIQAKYGTSLAQTLTMTNPVTTGYQVDMTAAATILATPISGGTYLRSSGTTTHAFNFSTPLSEVGFTVLARNAARTVTATVTYDNATTGAVGPFTVNANTAASATSAASSPDTFFGFAAPTGRSIVSLSVIETGNNNFVIDDLGFVVPEPTSAALLGLGGLGLLARRRRA